MTDLDEKIRQALKGSGIEPVDFDQEESLRAQVLETFRGQLRWISIGVWVEQLIFLALAIFAAVRFFQAESTRDLILWATIFLTCFWSTALMKLWFWMLLNRNAVIREVKRLELQVATLGRRAAPRDSEALPPEEP